MSNTVPAGYQLHVITWENDADHYMTEILSGLSKEDVLFYVDLLKSFYSKNGWEPKRGIGNAETVDAELIQIVQRCLSRHPNISRDTYHLWHNTDGDYGPEEYDETNPSDVAEFYHEILCDSLLGHPVTDYYLFDCHNFCRAFDSFKVLYFEHPGSDVTDQFS